MPNNSFEHKPAVREVLTACGFDSLRNEKEAMAELIIKVSCAYKVWDFDLSSAANTILKYNGLIVDAAQAIRKSMKEYDFHGGFHFSLEHMLQGEVKSAVKIIFLHALAYCLCCVNYKTVVF